MLELSPKTNLLEENDYRYSLQDVKDPILYRDVYNDAEKEELANNIAGAMAGVSPEVEQRCYWYWSQVDEKLGQRVKEIFTAS